MASKRWVKLARTAIFAC